MSISRHQAVGAYRRWEPQSFDEQPEEAEPEAAQPPEPPAEPEPEPPPQEPPEPEYTLPTADDIEAMFEQARAEGAATGHAEGHAAGYAAGYAEGAGRAREEAERLAGMSAELDRALTRLDEEVAEEILALAIEVARQMVRHTLAEHPAAVAETIKAALHQLPQGQARIHLNPGDAALMREHLADPLEHGHHRLVEDDTVTRGGARLEAANSQVDATVETRWRRVLEGLGRAGAAWQAPQ